MATRKKTTKKKRKQTADKSKGRPRPARPGGGRATRENKKYKPTSDLRADGTGYVIRSIEHAVKLGTTLTRSWFRGHARAVNELTPRVFRPKIDFGRGATGLHKKMLQLTAPGRLEGPPELELIEEFKRLAPSITDKLPAQDYNAEWLFLMQHSGLPTRLLDWTESALVGLYFVVSDEADQDGELWVMLPAALNAKSGFVGLPLPGHPVLRYIVNEPLYSAEKLNGMTGLKGPAKYAVAVDPPLKFPRLVSQQGTFTVHPRASVSEENTIPSALPYARNLVRYVIPAAAKKTLQRDLSALGITRASLFQDLDSLSTTLSQEIVPRVGYSPPDPPRFE